MTANDAPDTVQTVATPTLVFLWADTFAAPLTQKGQKGIISPSTGAIVDTKLLAEMMIAVTIAELQAQGAVRLEPYSKKSFGLFSSSGVNLHVVGEVPPRGRLLTHIARSGRAREKGESIADVVFGSTKHHNEHPESHVVQEAIDEAVEQGYMTRESAGGLRGATGATRAHPVKERVEETRPAARSLAETWKSFRDANPDLAKELRAAVRKGFEQRRRDSERDSEREYREVE